MIAHWYDSQLRRAKQKTMENSPEIGNQRFERTILRELAEGPYLQADDPFTE